MKPRQTKTRKKNVLNIAVMIGVLFLLSCNAEPTIEENKCECKVKITTFKTEIDLWGNSHRVPDTITFRGYGNDCNTDGLILVNTINIEEVVECM